ncbi:hypothetical protein [Streptomyces sp. NPDC005953]|uniref:hypothetical protein n=1 Tax=unclassified Streptomyces TaxID=2593676 RepID=UPI0033F980F7
MHADPSTERPRPGPPTTADHSTAGDFNRPTASITIGADRTTPSTGRPDRAMNAALRKGHDSHPYRPIRTT